MAIPLVLVVLPLGLLFLLSGLIANAVQVISRALGQAASSSVILLTDIFPEFVWCGDLNQFGREDLIFFQWTTTRFGSSLATNLSADFLWDIPVNFIELHFFLRLVSPLVRSAAMRFQFKCLTQKYVRLLASFGLVMVDLMGKLTFMIHQLHTRITSSPLPSLISPYAYNTLQAVLFLSIRPLSKSLYRRINSSWLSCYGFS